MENWKGSTGKWWRLGGTPATKGPRQTGDGIGEEDEKHEASETSTATSTSSRDLKYKYKDVVDAARAAEIEG